MVMAKALQVNASWKSGVYLNCSLFDIQGKVLTFHGKRKCLFVIEDDKSLFSLGSSYFSLMNASKDFNFGLW